MTTVLIGSPAAKRRLIENHTTLKCHGRFERQVGLDFFGKG